MYLPLFPSLLCSTAGASSETRVTLAPHPISRMASRLPRPTHIDIDADAIVDGITITEDLSGDASMVLPSLLDAAVGGSDRRMSEVEELSGVFSPQWSKV